MALVDDFIGAVAEDRRAAALVAHEALATALAATVTDARAEWPDLVVDPRAFMARLGRVLAAGSVLDALAAMRTDDLYLVTAALAGTPGAASAFDGHVMPAVRAQLRGLRLAADVADELTQHIRIKLLLGRGEHAPAIASFAGASDLRAWARVIAVREAASELRRPTHEFAVDNDLLQAMVGGADGSDVAALKAESRARLRTVLTQVIEALPARARLLVRLHHVEGVTLDALARMHNVHRATVARWLASAREAMIEHVQTAVADDQELMRDFAQASSRLELSLSRLFAPE